MKNIKKVVISCLVILAMCCTGISLAATGTITGRTVRIREKADANSNIITNAYRDEIVKVIDEEGDWYKVEYEGKVGYVSKEYLDVKEYNPTPEETPATETAVAETEVKNPSNTTVSKDTSIKLLPIFSSRSLGTITAGTEIEVKKQIGNWLKITAGTNVGWILKSNAVGYEIAGTTPAAEQTAETVENPEQTEETETLEEQADFSENTGYVNVNSVRIRESAGGNILGNLSLYEVVTIKGEEGDWYIVSCDGFENGYVSKDYITVGKVPSRSLTEERQANEEEEEVVEEEEEVVVEQPAPEPEPEPEYEPEPEPVYEEPVEEPDYGATESSSVGEAAAALAQEYVGCPYVYGGSSPSGFDCSGFTSFIYAQFGYSLSRSSSGQAYDGEYVSMDDLQPGDIILYQDYGRSRIGHSSLYIGDGLIVHAANPSKGVIISSIWESYYAERYVMARRIY